MSKVKFATCQGIYEYDATDMTKVEYEKLNGIEIHQSTSK